MSSRISRTSDAGRPDVGVGIVEQRLVETDAAALRDGLAGALARTPVQGVLLLRTRASAQDVVGILGELGARARIGPRSPDAPHEWSVAVLHAQAPEILDLRDLEAPEPLERILHAAAGLAPGAALLARTPRVPRMLLPQLERRGLEWRVGEEPDRSGLVWVRRPA